jgi:uncharacterized delta-60 repeat protein
MAAIAGWADWLEDPGFQPVFEASTRLPSNVEVLPHPDGGCLVLGSFHIINAQPWPTLARLRPDGALDPQFRPPADSVPLHVYADGRLLVRRGPGGALDITLERLLPNGAVDPTFRVVPISAAKRRPQVRVAADGSILLFGQFEQVHGVASGSLARLTANGDPAPGFTSPFVESTIEDVAFAPDGRLVVVGRLYRTPESFLGNAVRLQPDGTLDPTFPARTEFGDSGGYQAARVEPDGRVLLLGPMRTLAPNNVLRLLADGTVDPSFTPVSLPGRPFLLPGDSAIYVYDSLFSHTHGEIRRTRADGQVDPGFRIAFEEALITTSSPRRLVRWPGGPFYLTAAYSPEAHRDRRVVSRFGPSGDFDPSFSPRFSHPPGLSSLAVDDNDRAIVLGLFDYASGVPRRRIARLQANGAIDPTFNPSLPEGDFSLSLLAPNPDGSHFLFGPQGYWRLTSDGQFASGPELPAEQQASAVIPLSAGGGFYQPIGGELRRVSLTGQIDPLFRSTIPSMLTASAVAPDDGTFYVANPNGSPPFLRLRADGSPDPEFQPQLHGMPPTAGLVALSGKRLVHVSQSSMRSGDPPTWGMWLFGPNGQLVTNRSAPVVRDEFPVASFLIEAMGPTDTISAAVRNERQGIIEHYWIRGDGTAYIASHTPSAGESGNLLRRYRYVGAGRPPPPLTPGAPRGRIINLATRSFIDGESTVLISGFVIKHGPRTLLLRGVGPELRTYHVPDALDDPNLVIYDARGQPLASNDDWQDQPATAVAAVQAAMARTGAFPLPAGSRDAALVRDFPPGLYTVHLRARPGESGIGLLELYDASTAPGPGRLVNLSSRGRVTSGTGVLIPGIVVDGDAPVRLVLRGVGPALAPFIHETTIPTPQIELYRGDRRLRQNSRWGADLHAGALADAFQRVGAFALPADSPDAALLLDLYPGAYTVHCTDQAAASGQALVEVYEFEP